MLFQLIVSDFTFLTKIQYLYAGKDNWGEHEVDYIFFLQKDVHLEPNKDEITEVRYLSRSNLDE